MAYSDLVPDANIPAARPQIKPMKKNGDEANPIMAACTDPGEVEIKTALDSVCKKLWFYLA